MSKKGKKPVVYAFIDSQNLNLGVQSQGWNVDYKKLRLYLSHKYHVQNAYMFIGLVVGNEDLYEALQKAGFILIFKPTVQYFEDGRMTVKGNVDAELVLHAAAIEYSHYDKAIIVSGDGDFTCLVKYLSKKKKLLHVFAPNQKYSKLLEPYGHYIVNLSRLKPILEYTKKNKKDQHRRSVETLGLSGHGDTIESVTKRQQNVKRSRQQASSNRQKNKNAPLPRRALSDVKPKQSQKKLSDKNSVAKKTKKSQEKM